MYQSIPTDLMVVGAIALLVAACLAIKKATAEKFKDIVIKMPDVLRTNILFGYYSSLKGQYEETKDHINLFWHSNFYGVDEFVRILKDTDCKIVLDLAPFLSVKTIITPPVVIDTSNVENLYVQPQPNVTKLTLNPNAVDNLRGYFNILKENGVLHKLTYLYPIDEPEFSVKDEAEFKKMVEISKAVAAEYEELNDAKFAVIHGSHKDFWCIPDLAIHGVDDYDQKSQVLTIGEHARLVKALLPGQKTFLVPGCAMGQIPAPFVAYAHLNPDEVEAIVPFLWFDDPDHKDVKYTGLVARTEKFKKLWIDAAKSCIAR